MKVDKPGLRFNSEGNLVLERPDGRCALVRHPDGLLGASGITHGDRCLVGAFALDDGSDAGRVYVDLLDFGQPSRVQRWTVGGDDVCTQPCDFELTMEQPIGPSYIISPMFMKAAQKRLNDLQIYTLLLMLRGRAAAAAYLQEWIAVHRTHTGAPCKLVVIFNHHFIRNCNTLHDFYVDRFPDIDFVLPCVAPTHPNYYAYSFGSYQFHGLITSYLRDQQQAGRSTVQNYLIIQDDVLLHPKLTAHSVAELLSGDHGGWFPVDNSYDVNSREWLWAQRIANTLDNQRDALVGNGFEGLNSVVSKRRMRQGISDCFALRAPLIPEFLDRLSPMVAANLFPEVALPTALYGAVLASGMKIAVRPGILLWGKDRSKVNDPSYIEAFISSDAAFLHPVKIAANDAVLRTVNSIIKNGNN